MYIKKPLRFVGLLLILLLLASCGTASSSEQGTPSPTAEPTPATTVAPSPTPTSPSDVSQKSKLVEMLGSIPKSVGDNGLWFGNIDKALDMADVVKTPETAEELAAYQKAVAGIFVDRLVSGNSPQFEEVFSYDAGDISSVVLTGPMSTWPFSTVLASGTFDSDTIVQKLLALGYQEREVARKTYYAIRGDREQDSEAGGSFALAKMNRVYTDDDTVVRSPDTAPVENILKVLAGEAPSILEDPGFASVAANLGDPLAAAIMNYETAMDVSNISGASELAKQEDLDWVGSIGEWDLLGVGYGKREKTEAERFQDDSDVLVRELKFVLHYADGQLMDGADRAITRRLMHYEAGELLQQMGVAAQPFGEYCTGFNTSPPEHVVGSQELIVVRCALDAEAPDPIWFWTMLETRDIGFLVP